MTTNELPGVNVDDIPLGDYEVPVPLASPDSIPAKYIYGSLIIGILPFIALALSLYVLLGG